MRNVLLMVLATASISIADDRPARTIPGGESTRERFLKLLDRPRVDLRSTVESTTFEGRLAISRFSFDSEQGERVPGLMVRQTALEGRQPVVIVLHGTGGSKQAMLPLMKKFAELGVTGVAIDARYAGERSRDLKAGEAYRNAILETWRTGRGFPFLYDTVWDVMRLLDYLESRPVVDHRRIGAIGFSKGGMELYLGAAADERLAASVPCIGVQSFAWALENNAWQSRISTIQSAADGAAREVGLSSIDSAFVQRFYERVVPGIHREFDAPAMLPLIAPRPLLVINGERDDRTPMPGLELCVSAARHAYERVGEPERFIFRPQPNTGHAVTPESEKLAIDWLLHNLSKNNTNSSSRVGPAN